MCCQRNVGVGVGDAHSITPLRGLHWTSRRGYDSLRPMSAYWEPSCEQEELMPGLQVHSRWACGAACLRKPPPRPPWPL